jgi:hypothetical protein
VQGALYFPLISVPVSGWLTRSLLYWDTVGTIVPQEWIDAPEELGAHTQDLVRRGLLRQVFPNEAADSFEHRFRSWIAALEPQELSRRQASFQAGERTPIHVDKWMNYMSGIDELRYLGLSGPFLGHDWVVEPNTANDFMAALALALCDPDSELCQPGCSWTPATNDPTAFSSLLSGLHPSTTGSAAQRDMELRVRGHMRTAQLRTSFLTDALPVPGEPLGAEEIERFRDKHAGKLPRCRRRIEEALDGALLLSDEDLQVRALDRLSDEVVELTAEAEAYLREAGLRRVSRSPLLRMLKVVPGLSGRLSAAHEAAETLQSDTRVDSEALAYLAFARAELELAPSYECHSGKTLAEIFQ